MADGKKHKENCDSDADCTIDSSRKTNKWFVASFGRIRNNTACICFGLAMLGTICLLFFDSSKVFGDWIGAQASEKWPATTGIIVESKVNHGSKANLAEVKYAFEVNGKTYKCSRISFEQIHYAGWANRLPLGKTVKVRYNPDKPYEAVLRPGVNVWIIFWRLFGISATLSTIGLLKAGTFKEIVDYFFAGSLIDKTVSLFLVVTWILCLAPYVYEVYLDICIEQAFDQCNYHDADTFCAENVQCIAFTHGIDSSSYAEAVQKLAVSHWKQGKDDAANDEFERLLRCLEISLDKPRCLTPVIGDDSLAEYFAFLKDSGRLGELEKWHSWMETDERAAERLGTFKFGSAEHNELRFGARNLLAAYLLGFPVLLIIWVLMGWGTAGRLLGGFMILLSATGFIMLIVEAPQKQRGVWAVSILPDNACLKLYGSDRTITNIGMDEISRLKIAESLGKEGVVTYTFCLESSGRSYESCVVDAYRAAELDRFAEQVHKLSRAAIERSKSISPRNGT